LIIFTFLYGFVPLQPPAAGALLIVCGWRVFELREGETAEKSEMVEARNGWGTGLNPRQPKPESTVLPLDYPQPPAAGQYADELISYQS